MREGELIILLGAGTSVERYPSLERDGGEGRVVAAVSEAWTQYLEEYPFIKASLMGAEVMKGKPAIAPDIERIVNTLSELEKNTDCTLYPFISGSHQRFCRLAGRNFDCIRSFRQLIVRRLRDWIAISSASEVVLITKDCTGFEMS